MKFSAFLLGLVWLLGPGSVQAENLPSGWGINGRISQLSEPELSDRLHLLRQAGVNWFREDYRFKGSLHTSQARNLDEAKKQGFRILALIPYSVGRGPRNPENQLNEDLLEVFQTARRWAAQGRGRVDAWELYNEADVGFCRDLPDRSVAYMKAVYLGLKAGSESEDIPVMMGALALPPGPWLEKAARNGLLDYADAYNFHYYGHPEDFAGVIREHRKFLQFQHRAKSGPSYRRDDFPMWVTECGYAVELPKKDRKLQTAYLAGTARTAWEFALNSFMPYALTDNQGFALLERGGKPGPAWEEFREFASTHGLASHLSFKNSRNADPVVLQWLPQTGKALPHKPSGTYRFLPAVNSGKCFLMAGEIRIYNFGTIPLRGKLTLSGPRRIQVEAGFEPLVPVPSGGMVTIPVTFSSPSTGYVREEAFVDFEMENNKWEHPETKGNSRLVFGLETRPHRSDFREEALDLRSLDANESFQFLDPGRENEITSSGPNWVGMNGVKVRSTDGRTIQFYCPEKAAGKGPPLLLAKMRGLPRGAFLRLRSDRAFDPNFYLRVDLVDSKGQRFSIFENSGMSYFERSHEVWLNLKDFHLYFWGRAENARFDPSTVREIQLRPYCKEGQKEIRLSIELMRPVAFPMGQ